MFAPGRIEAVDLGRQFRVATGQGRSLKATLLRREAAVLHEFWALRHVNLEIEPGETFGIVGRNGSGKSTFLKMLARIYGPSEGSCRVGGRMSSLLELGAGFHPEFNAVENIFLAGSVYGIPKNELKKDVDEIIAFAELEQFAFQPIKTYSSGMFMRLGFSVAMHVRPDVLLLDEVLAVGDERFIQKCLGRIAQYRREGGTMLLVTHDAGTVQRLCQRAMLLERGEPQLIGTANEVIALYHERLAGQTAPTEHAEPHRLHQNVFDLDTRVTNVDRAEHNQYVEGETIAITASLTASVDVPAATLTFRLRDELGREIGARDLPGLEFHENAPQSHTLVLDSAPLRDGLFQLDVLVRESSGGATLLEATAIQTISFYGQQADADGPIQLGGRWQQT